MDAPTSTTSPITNHPRTETRLYSVFICRSAPYKLASSGMRAETFRSTENTALAMEHGIFFYNPAGNSKQSGLATGQQSHWVSQPVSVGPAQPPTPPTISYPRAPQGPAYVYPQQQHLQAMPPVASPQPTYHHANNFLHLDVDVHMSRAVPRGGTATPPLTRCNSINNTPSPQSATLDYLPTPSYAFFPTEVEGVKRGCEREVSAEVLATTELQSEEMHEFIHLVSPPVTPGM